MSDRNCADAIGTIAAIQRFKKDSGQDITPRLVRWGLSALEKRGTSLVNVKRGWSELTPEQRWRRVRAYLPGSALDTLAAILEREYGAPVEQLSLVQVDEGKTTDDI